MFSLLPPTSPTSSIEAAPMMGSPTAPVGIPDVFFAAFGGGGRGGGTGRACTSYAKDNHAIQRRIDAHSRAPNSTAAAGQHTTRHQPLRYYESESESESDSSSPWW